MGNMTVKLVNTSASPISDDALVRAASEFANGAELSVELEGKAFQATAAHRREFIKWLESSFKTDTGVQVDYAVINLVLKLKIKQTFYQPDECGMGLRLFRKFKSVRALLAYAVALTLDSQRISRCKLKSCRTFFVPKQNPHGGKPNRTYCCPEHMKEHHNSSERRFGKA